MKFKKLSNKIKISSLLIAGSFVTGAILVPYVLTSTTNTTNKNNQNLYNSINNKQKKDAQIVNNVNDIVVDTVNTEAENSYAIVNNKGVQEIYAWGRNNYGQLGVGDTQDHKEPTKIQLVIPEGAIIEDIQISSSSFILYSLDGVQVIYVWGYNADYKLGLKGDNTPKSTPQLFTIPASADGKIRKFSILRSTSSNSGYFILDVTGTTTSKVFVWGLNASGQLGDGTTTAVTEPTPFNPPTNVIGAPLVDFNIGSHTSSDASSYAIYDKAGLSVVYVWGLNTSGQLGISNVTNQPTPVLFDRIDAKSKITKMNIDSLNGYALTTTNGITDIYVWGMNTFGQLGQGGTSSSSVPLKISRAAFGNGVITDIYSFYSNRSFFALINNGSSQAFYAWGWNDLGQLGLGTQTNQLLPALISSSYYGGGIITALQPNEKNIVMTTTNTATNKQTVYVWGDNQYGQLGLGNNTNALRPTALTNSFLTDAIVNLPHPSEPLSQPYGAFSTLLKVNKNNQTSYYISGRNNYGQSGIGSLSNTNTFVEIVPTRFSQPTLKEFVSKESAQDAFIKIYDNNIFNQTELEKYVDLTSFPSGSTYTIDKAKTTIDNISGTINLCFTSSSYYDSLIYAPRTNIAKDFKIAIEGFRPIHSLSLSPVDFTAEFKTNFAHMNEIFTIVTDANGIVKPDMRDVIEKYINLRAIPYDAVIHLKWNIDVRNLTAVVEFTSDRTYTEDGRSQPHQYKQAIEGNFGVGFDPVIVAIISAAGVLALVITGLSIYYLRKRKQRSRVWSHY